MMYFSLQKTFLVVGPSLQRHVGATPGATYVAEMQKQGKSEIGGYLCFSLTNSERDNWLLCFYFDINTFCGSDY